MVYKWNSRKKSRCQHICSPNGKTLCKAENGRIRLDTISKTPDPQRKVCSMCEGLSQVTTKKTEKRKINNKKKDGFYNSFAWRELRYKVLRHYGSTCMCCGATDKDAKMCVDHIKSRKMRPDLELDFNNMQVLCDPCNHGKGRYDDTDFRRLEISDECQSHMDDITRH